jgi:hypothetical protein
MGQLIDDPHAPGNGYQTYDEWITGSSAKRKGIEGHGQVKFTAMQSK